MKTILSLMMLTLATTNMLAQTTQDSINTLKKEIKEKQLSLEKLQKNATADFDRDNIIDKIIDDMYEMKLITSKEKLSFSLSNVKMEVNNKKQTEEIFQKFKSKYGISEGTSILCSKKNGNSSTSITINN
jgi:hypothetical protein